MTRPFPLALRRRSFRATLAPVLLRPTRVSLLASFAALSFSLMANAEAPSIDARNFRPSTDPNGSVYLEPTRTPGAGEWNAGAWVSYALDPAIVRLESERSRLISHQLSADFIANIGIGDRGALGIDVPAIVWQAGDSDPLVHKAMGDSRLPKMALGDIALTAKANLLSYDLGGFGLAALGRLTLPTGERTSFLGEGAPTSELRLIGEYDVLVASLQATAGFKLRTEQRDFLDVSYGNEIPFGAALVVRPQALGLDDRGRWTWIAEVHGSKMLPISTAAEHRGQTTAKSPVLASLSARYAFHRNASVLFGAETAVTNALGDPTVRFFASLQWAPRFRDRDGDGIEDHLDQCPDLPEDRDGFEDWDGCPEWEDEDDGEDPFARNEKPLSASPA